MKTAERVQQLAKSANTLHFDFSESKKKQMSSDFHWFSPILKQQLNGLQADAVVMPKSVDELKELVRNCVKYEVPLTIRGSGTGNYGQSIPIQGGIAVDFTALNKIHHFDAENGVIHAQAGIRLKQIEDLALQYGYELRCKPSTYKIATLGGFFAGGFGGIGSINYGPLNAVGNFADCIWH